MSRKMLIGAGLGGIAVGAAAVALAGQGGSLSANSDRAQVEGIVREYILANPEIIPEAVKRLQERESGKLVDSRRAAFETPFAGAWAGAENGDVVLVEFFDYACGFCRKTNEDIYRLLKEDPKLKVVWRELPVLGQDSVDAAEVSLAAARQGKFRQFYDQMFAQGRPDASALAAAQRAAGVSGGSADPAFKAEIEKNYELARTINASGTPTFVVGDQVLQGAVGYDALKEAIARARAG